MGEFNPDHVFDKKLLLIKLVCYVDYKPISHYFSIQLKNGMKFVQLTLYKRLLLDKDR